MRKTIRLAVFSILCLTSCEDILEVPDISNEQVGLLAPSQGSTVTDSTVHFNWDSVMGTDAYLVQIANPSFENANQFVLDTLVVVDSTFVGSRITKTLSNGDYEWRVKAQNSAFDTEFSTSGFTVYVSMD